MLIQSWVLASTSTAGDTAATACRWSRGLPLRGTLVVLETEMGSKLWGFKKH
jgi:hypothetical protein